jgi:uncharacterized membrane protein
MSDPRNDAHAKKVGRGKKKPQVAEAEAAVVTEIPTVPPSAALEGSLAVLAKLKDLEFQSRGHLERLAELALTVEDELKQKDLAGPLSEVYSAQSAVQTALTALLEAYKAECERLQG